MTDCKTTGPPGPVVFAQLCRDRPSGRSYNVIIVFFRPVGDAGPYNASFWANKNATKLVAYFILQGNQTARSTLLERRHLVQAYTWHGVPLTTALTRLTLGFQVRLERLWEWETLIPKVTPLPQKSHFAIRCTSHPNHNPRNDAIRRRLDMIAEFRQKCKHYFSFF